MQYQDSRKIRPLSPHLGIYKPQISSVLSIFHRISGVINFSGLLGLVWCLVYVAFSSSDITNSWLWNFFKSWLGNLVLISWSFSVFFHFCTGLRHLAWDLGWGFKVKAMEISGLLAVAMAIALTITTWIIIFNIV